MIPYTRPNGLAIAMLVVAMGVVGTLVQVGVTPTTQTTVEHAETREALRCGVDIDCETSEPIAVTPETSQSASRLELPTVILSQSPAPNLDGVFDARALAGGTGSVGQVLYEPLMAGVFDARAASAAPPPAGVA